MLLQLLHRRTCSSMDPSFKVKEEHRDHSSSTRSVSYTSYIIYDFELTILRYRQAKSPLRESADSYYVELNELGKSDRGAG